MNLFHIFITPRVNFSCELIHVNISWVMFLPIYSESPIIVDDLGMYCNFDIYILYASSPCPLVC